MRQLTDGRPRSEGSGARRRAVVRWPPAPQVRWPPGPPPGRHSRARPRRRVDRLVLGRAGLVVLVLALTFLLAWGVEALVGGAPPPRRTVAARPGPRPIGQTTLTLVDTSRTVDHPPVVGPRRLVTWVLYPARRGASGSRRRPARPRLDARPAPGRWPLVVFGEGFDRVPQQYTGLLEAWARAGFVVAAPAFPLTNAGLAARPGGLTNLDEADIVNQPADMVFVIRQLLADSASPGHLLSHAIDPDRVAVAGHSDGADTAAAVAYDSAVAAPHLDAAIVMAGQQLNLPQGGTYFGAGGPPLLVVQGTADRVDPPAQSQALYRAASVPKDYLSLAGAGHDRPYEGTGQAAFVVHRVTVDFLRTYLAGDAAERPALARAGNVPGVATMVGHR